VLTSVTLSPGARALLLDLSAMKTAAPRVVAAACRVRDERAEGRTLTFRAEGIADTNAVVRIAARTAPSEILVSGKPAGQSQYDYSDGAVRLRFVNSAEGVPIEIRW
jgi:hypothetical protein